MPTFIQDLARRIINEHQDFDQLSVVLPSKRAVGFLKKELVAQLSQKSNVGLLPMIIDIEQFIIDLSGLQPIDPTESILLFYKAYLNVPEEQPKKDFESFSSWGQTLLQDFNEIDRYLVDHDTFFNYLYYINDQKHWFLQEEKTELVENYIHLWEQLKHYYKAFVDLIRAQGIGFQGLQYREAAKAIDSYLKKENRHVFFAGFNALNNAEQHIIKTCINENKGTVVWDADTYFLNEKYHDASHFLRKYKRQWNIEGLFSKDEHNSYSAEKSIYLTGIAKNIGQVKYVGQLLSEMSEEALNNTAVILANEELLFPMLSSIPPNVTAVNITMGLPFATIPVANLVHQLIALQKNVKPTDGFYYKEVNGILDHHIIQALIGVKKCRIWKEKIIQNNWIYLPVSLFEKDLILSSIFCKTTSLNDFNSKLIFLFEQAQLAFQNIKQEEDSQYCQRISNILEEIDSLLQTHRQVVTLRSFEDLFNQKISQQQIDFIGNPHQGLQIMGVLESRCLDFDTVIFVGVNEGNLPAGKKGTSFIPYDLKVSMDLPTYKEKDAIFAYHFYRALQRCKTAHLIYNTVVDDMNGGEKSRFIQQLELLPHPNHNVTKNMVSIPPAEPMSSITSIAKDAFVIEKLKGLFSHGISPSALATYLRDPIQFYERYILGVKEIEEVEEEAAANTQGTVIHNVLETFYEPFLNKILVAEDIKHMLTQVDDAVTNEFHKVYGKNNVDSGRNFIIIEVAKTYLKKFLKKELKTIEEGNEIQIVAIEGDFSTSIQIPTLDIPIKIKGKVDRVDRFNGALRVIDYKTGKVDPGKLKIYDWSMLHKEESYSKALQLLMYAYMYQKMYHPTEHLTAGIISFKKLNDGVLYFGTKDAPRSRTVDLDITPNTFESFLEAFGNLVTEIFDINTPFSNDENI